MVNKIIYDTITNEFYKKIPSNKLSKEVKCHTCSMIEAVSILDKSWSDTIMSLSFAIVDSKYNLRETFINEIRASYTLKGRGMLLTNSEMDEGHAMQDILTSEDKVAYIRYINEIAGEIKYGHLIPIKFTSGCFKLDHLIQDKNVLDLLNMNTVIYQDFLKYWSMRDVVGITFKNDIIAFLQGRKLLNQTPLRTDAVAGKVCAYMTVAELLYALKSYTLMDIRNVTIYALLKPEGISLCDARLSYLLALSPMLNVTTDMRKIDEKEVGIKIKVKKGQLRIFITYDRKSNCEIISHDVKQIIPLLNSICFVCLRNGGTLV